MDNNFTKEELQHIMTIMNAFGEPDCEVCASARNKLETMIESLTFFSIGE